MANLIRRHHREYLLAQRGVVIWITGSSDSFREDLSRSLEVYFYKELGFLTCFLNDKFSFGRNILNKIIKLLVNSALVVICSFSFLPSKTFPSSFPIFYISIDDQSFNKGLVIDSKLDISDNLVKIYNFVFINGFDNL